MDGRGGSLRNATSFAVGDWRCFRDANVAGSCVGPCPQQLRFEPCRARCAATSRCRSIITNKFGQCYLKHGVDIVPGESSQHETVSCIRRVPSMGGRGDVVDAALSLPALPILVINLNRSAARLRKMEAQLGSVGVGGVGWRRISAVYGDSIPPGCLQTRSCAPDTLGAQGTPRLHPRNAAVAFSHMRAWRAVEALPERGWGAAIVLEDDVKLAPGFATRATELWRKAAPLDPDFLHLTLFRHLTPPHCVQRLVAGRRRRPAPATTAALEPLFARLRCPLGMNTGAQAYVVSRRGAARAREALLPLRINTSVTPHAASFDLLMGRASMWLERFALARQRDEPATHDWKARSIRVHGLSAGNDNRRK